jgi:signal peptidase II
VNKLVSGSRKWLLLIIIAVIVFAADQVTKQLVIGSIPLNTGIEVIPGFFDLAHVRNPGVAFGMMSGSAWSFQRTFFILLSLAAMAAVLWVIYSSAGIELALLAGYCLFFGGALGNLIDRVRFGEVIDFLDVHWGNVHWPAFNVADSALCVGASLFLIHFIFKKNNES